MSGILPLHIQRRLEQRWSSRFLRSVPPAATPKHRFEEQNQQLAAIEPHRRKNEPSAGVGLPGDHRSFATIASTSQRRSDEQ
jgi:hypothetical protein